MGKDPAFLFYDGDAARDVSHMNRLERGCYFDFIQAQKKFGPLTLQVIQKILGKDFSECWPALKICLTYEKDMYFISWLQISIEKRQKYSEGRSKNRKGSKQPTNKENESTYVNHMENAIVNENVINNKKEPIYKLEIFEAIFTDDIFIGNLQMAHRGKDLKQAWEECWIHHSNAGSPPGNVGEWKQKLNTWLSNTKINGTSKNKREQNSSAIREAIANDILREHGSG